MELKPSEKYNYLKQQLVRVGQLYVDPEFPATGASIGGKYTHDPKIKWLRPHDLVDDPQFVIQGMTRIDIFQGTIRDCFLLAGAACMAVQNPAMLFRVIPPGQNFGIQYTGMFRFNFWRYDRWVEVIIDDQLPTIRGKLMNARNKTKGSKNEFWISLLEKAYAKLYGNYINIDTGFVNEALTDLTGGVSEIIKTELYRHKPDTLFDLMTKMIRMSSFLGCAVNLEATQIENALDNGLFEGHAYSITKLQKLKHRGEIVNLIRLRNPWGRKEWNGAWGDKSSKWRKLDENSKLQLEYFDDNDGEFWMDFDDWINNFEGLYICHLTPDAMMGEIKRDLALSSWHQQMFHGQWIPGVTAGGCGNRPYKALFWRNPQYMLELQKENDFDGDSRIALVISVTQKGRTDETNDYINFLLFKVKRGVDTSEPRQYGAHEVTPIKRHKDFINVRDVTDHFRYLPGKYLVIPCQFNPNKPGEFLLRIFSEMAGTPPFSIVGVYS